MPVRYEQRVPQNCGQQYKSNLSTPHLALFRAALPFFRLGPTIDLYSRVSPSKPNQIEDFTVDILYGPNANNSTWHFKWIAHHSKWMLHLFYSVLRIETSLSLSLCNKICGILGQMKRGINISTEMLLTANSKHSVHNLVYWLSLFQSEMKWEQKARERESTSMHCNWNELWCAPLHPRFCI